MRMIKSFRNIVAALLICSLLITPMNVAAFEVTVNQSSSELDNELQDNDTNSVLMYSDVLTNARAINSDVAAVLRVGGTNITYPVVLNRSKVCTTHKKLDNCFYEHHSLNGQYTGAFDNNSSIFADARNSGLTRSSLDKNTIIYGHNWTNVESYGPPAVARDSDKMFAQLPSFSDLSFARQNRYFIIENTEEQLYFLIFAVVYTDTWDSRNPNGFYYLDTNPTDMEFLQLQHDLKAKSVRRYEVPVDETDKIVILSTCTYKQRRDGFGRMLLVGRLLREGETCFDYPNIN